MALLPHDGPPQTPKPPDVPPGGDPSMEDILASIRRILNEDEAPTPSAGPVHTAGTADDVLELNEDMIVPDEPHSMPAAPERPPATAASLQPKPQPVEPQPVEPLPVEPLPIEPRAVEPPHAAPPVMAPLAAPAPIPSASQTLVAPEAENAAATSLGALVRTLAQERSTAVHRGGPTIEDLVRGEIRPLLKEWLDIHLPPLVERLVRTEIERVVGRAGS